MTPYVVNDEESANKKERPMGGGGDVLVLQDDTGSSSGGEAGTPLDGVKPLLNGKGKAVPGSKASRGGALKRVSFGSSKGSMVETLVYDHGDELPSRTTLPNGKPATDPQLITNQKVPTIEEKNGVEEDSGGGGGLFPSRLKVTFYECQRPNYVTTPESPDTSLDFFLLHHGMANSPTGKDYNRQESTDSGLDNPFRPDGELSREADTIVTLIKEGKPITPVKSEPDGGYLLPDGEDKKQQAEEAQIISPQRAPANLESSKSGANGTAPPAKVPPQPGLVEVQHGIVVPPSDASQVEQVVIKKKPKCKCCVIQ